MAGVRQKITSVGINKKKSQRFSEKVVGFCCTMSLDLSLSTKISRKFSNKAGVCFSFV